MRNSVVEPCLIEANDMVLAMESFDNYETLLGTPFEVDEAAVESFGGNVKYYVGVALKAIAEFFKKIGEAISNFFTYGPSAGLKVSASAKSAADAKLSELTKAAEKYMANVILLLSKTESRKAENASTLEEQIGKLQTELNAATENVANEIKDLVSKTKSKSDFTVKFSDCAKAANATKNELSAKLTATINAAGKFGDDFKDVEKFLNKAKATIMSHTTKSINLYMKAIKACSYGTLKKQMNDTFKDSVANDKKNAAKEETK